MRVGLLLEGVELEQIRKKIQNCRWAANGYRRLRGQADGIFMGDRPSRGTLGALEAAAVVFAVSGEREYARQSEALIRSCGGFPELFGALTSDTYNFGCNTLLAGHQLPHLCVALDLLWDELSEKTRDHAVQNQVLPAVKHLRTNDRRDSNWQTAHSAGLLSAGLLLGDQGLSDFALNSPDHGLRRHMATSFRSDGLHWEGSFGYHHATLSSLLIAAEMARRAGADLYAEGDGTPCIKRMLDAPIRMAFPDTSLPVNNDSSGHFLSDLHQAYELGYARYRDPAYGWIIEKGDRASLYALLFGEEEVRSQPPESRSGALEQSGWTILKGVEGARYWESDAIVAVLDYGPHGDWHGHPDKLGVEVFAGGLYWIQNVGSPVGYHGQQHWEYFRRTLAHNTVVVDFQDQRFERARDDAIRDLGRTGRLIDLSLDGPQKSVSASVDWAYDGVRYRRTLTLSADCLTDAFEVSSDQVHTYDYILHSRGVIEAISLEVERARFPQTEGGYEYFVQVARARSDRDWAVVFKDGGWPDGRFAPTGKRLDVSMTGEEGTEVYTGYGPSNFRGVNVPFILARRKTGRTIFCTTFKINNDRPERR